MNVIGGILPALITPFDANGQVSPSVIRQLVQFQLKAGVHGFFVNGGTGEGLLLEPAERRLVLETVLDEVNGRVPVIAHVGAIATQVAADLAAHAAAVGAAAVSSIPPVYVSVDHLALKEHYRQIAQAAGQLPVWIYYIPQSTGVSLTVERFIDLLEIESIVGIKYTSHNFFEMRNVIESSQPRSVQVLSGPDEMCLPALVMGAQGAIGTTYNIMPAQFVQLYNSFQAGDLAQAQAIQYEANRIIKALLSVPILAAVKEVLTSVGIDCGAPRRPQRPLTPEERQRLFAALESTALAEFLGVAALE